MTRNEVKEVMYVIANEYKDFLPDDDKRITVKIDTWYYSLKNYESKIVKNKVIELVHTHVYGTPTLANLMTLLNPVMEKQNIGQEFSDRFISLLRLHGASGIGEAIKNEFGEVGYQVYLNNKESARILLESDILTFKAQLRNVFNSMHEREALGVNTDHLLGNDRMNNLIGSGVAEMVLND